MGRQEDDVDVSEGRRLRYLYVVLPFSLAGFFE